MRPFARGETIALFIIIVLMIYSSGFFSLCNRDNVESNRQTSKLDSEEFNPNFVFKGRKQDDPELATYLRGLLRPPSVHPYRLDHPEKRYFTLLDQSKYVENIYGNRRRAGFFVEVGGFNGEHGSLSLFLERELGFTGLLIEANPENYKELLKKERKAYTINAALSPTDTTDELHFVGTGLEGHLTEEESESSISVKAFPLYAYLMALNVTLVDFFNLDIEGLEFKVLRTIPWDKVKFGIMAVEHLKIPEDHKELIRFMEDRGYIKVLKNHYDYMFVDPAYVNKFNKNNQ